MLLVLALTTGCLVTAGCYLLLRRNLVKLLFGLVLLGHAANLLIFTLGGLVRGAASVVPPGASAPRHESADPLPQALVLTAIVIGFGMTAFLVALALRALADLGDDRADAGDEE